MGRRFVVVSLLAGLTASGACVPPDPPGPTAPRWVPTVLAASVVPGAELHRVATATTADWWAVVEQAPVVGPSAATTTLRLHRRSGSDGRPAATPAQTIPLSSGFAAVAMSDRVLAVRHRDAVAGLDVVDLYRWDEPTSAWVAAAAVPRGLASDRLVSIAVSDSTLVIGDRAGQGSTADGVVLAVPIVLGPGTLAASISSAQPLAPDPAWSAAERQGFGRVVATEGDVLATSAANDHVRTYRRVRGTWAVDGTVTNPTAPGSDGRFGASLAVDTSTGPARLMIGQQGGFSFGVPTSGRATLHERGSSGWTEVSTIAPRAGNALNGFAHGSQVALDGRWAVIGFFWAQVPGAPGSGSVDEYRLEVYDLAGGSVVFAAELSPLSAVGGPKPAQSSAVAAFVSIAGTHVSAVAWETVGSVGRYSAVSWDRRPAG